MKPGFLQGKQLDAGVASAATIITNLNHSKSKIKIPSTPVVPDGGGIPSYDPHDRGPAYFVTLPPGDLVAPGEPVTECLLRPSMKEKILAIPGFPHPFVPIDPPRSKIVPIPGAGLGLVATTDIDIGEDIVIERPLILATGAVPQLGPSPWQDPRTIQWMLVSRLTKGRAEEFYALHNCKGYTRPHHTGIIDTNGVGAGTLPGYEADCTAICKVISRVNHSCSSNAFWKFHLASFTVHLRAVLPIQKGEEITVSYGGKGKPREPRQKFLLERYKFNCTCPPCASKSTTNDEARIMITLETANKNRQPDVDVDLRKWATDRTKPDDLIVAEARLMINILDEERCYISSYWEIWYQRIVKAYCALEDEENARKWARKAAKLARGYALHDGGWDAVVEDPKRTDWWGLRANARSGRYLVKNLDGFNAQKSLTPMVRMGLLASDRMVSTIRSVYAGM